MSIARVVTLKDVSRRANVSAMTASRVLNLAGGMDGSIGIKDETRRRVVLAARRLGYRPNAAARTMVTGRFFSVGLVLSSNFGASHMPSSLLDSIHDELAANNLHLTVAKLPDEKLTDEAFVPEILREWRVDGLLINYNHHIPRRMEDLIESNDIPAIWMSVRRRHDCVYADNADALNRATRSLIELGHRRIAYWDGVGEAGRGPETHHGRIDRFDAYTRTMRGAGLAPRELPPRDHTPPQLVAVTAAMKRDDRPTAVMTDSTENALLIIRAAMSANLSIPRDLSVLCLASTGEAGPESAFPLSTYGVSEQDRGRVAVRMLVEKIADPTHDFAPRAIRFEPSDWPGPTCAPPPSSHPNKSIVPSNAPEES